VISLSKIIVDIVISRLVTQLANVNVRENADKGKKRGGIITTGKQ
jgi:hypothetical protein